MPNTSISFMPLSVVWILGVIVVPSLAQTSKLFQWQFANTVLSTSIPTCVPLPIVVKSFDPTTNATNGTPPYYMMAFAVGGTPTTTLIGTDENNLSWTVDQPVGSQLVLSVVDANGSAGGIPPQILKVIAGPTTRCVTTPLTTPPFTVTANVTGDLTTCQPWGLTVKGGVPPYNVTLAALNSPVVTNVTIPFGLDTFTFIDRADPNGQLIAAISDFTGRWATGTPIVQTKGQADVSCVGLVSSSGDSKQIKQQEDAALAASQSAKRRHSAIVGVAVTLVLLVVFGLAGAAFFQMRKRKQAVEQVLPTQYVFEPKRMSVTNDLPGPISTQPISGKAALAMREAQNSYSNAGTGIQSSSSSQTLSTPPLSYQDSLGRSTSATVTISADVRPQRESRASNPGFSKFPTSSIRRSAKQSEASVATARPPDSEYPETSTAVSASPANGGTPLAMTRVDEEVGVFQHRDASMVRELPPPYADRVRRSRPSSS